MKNLFLTICLTAITAFTFAQSIKFGVKAGFNMSTQSLSKDDPLSGFKYQYTTGFNAGVILDIDFKNFSLEPGVSFTTKGEKRPSQQLPANFSGPAGYNAPQATFTLDYIEASFNAFYNIHVAPGAIIHLGGGTYLGNGIAASATGLKASFNNDPNAAIHYKNPDYGVNFIAGVKLKKKILIDLGYSLGIADVSPNSSSLKNRVASLSVGYLFR
ncbi:MAG: PorT family protein [Mucilaginibacter sp.]|nr:PorT family protein [Mucilaginibacter sp.]